MTMLESKPERIRKYFMDPAIKYASVSYEIAGSVIKF